MGGGEGQGSVAQTTPTSKEVTRNRRRIDVALSDSALKIVMQAA